MPRKISISIMPTTIMSVDRPWPVMYCTMPPLAPENDKICAKVVAPRMMNRIMPEMPAVPLSALSTASHVKAR